ncbi:MAG: NAD(P)/FAD-dependent oxidoreductase [Lachnospiraceae bacterium]
MAEYVIIGNGIASTGCIEGIRSLDKDSKISVVAAEKYPTYCRPLISYMLEGKTDAEKMKYRPDSYYEENNVEVLYGRKVVSIDPDSKKAVLDDGSCISYTALCNATGSSPFIPHFDGLEKVEKKFSFMTLDDAFGLDSAIDPDSRVLIIGAGLIGLKCAEGICERVKKITVCDLADRILSSILDGECAAMMEKPLKEKGVEFMLNDSAASFEVNPADGSYTAIMKSGKSVDFDVVVLAIGVRANTELVKEAGGECGRGIIVDRSMKTSLDDIYAAGDCAEGFDSSINANRVLAILPNAYMQGHCAGRNMAGAVETFDNAIPMNSIGFFGLHAMSAGSYPDDGEIYEEKTETTLKRLFIKDGYLKGFMLIGDIQRAGIYTSLIRERVSLDTIDFDVLKKSPSLAAFSSDKRFTKLGGVV